VDLQPDERVIYQGHPSWRAIISFYLKGAFIALLVAAAVAAVTGVTDEVRESLVVLVFAAVVGVTILAGFIKRIVTSYTVTDRRLNIRRGIVARHVQETRLERVQNVNYNQGVLDRLLQVGDVDFDTAAGDDYNFVFAGVAEPEEVVEQVDRATGRGGEGLGGPNRA
jgi:uncharacterized membrane protein YdbT with pleckstrin-like domain